MLSQNSIEYSALYFACGRAGLVTQPMNWRLSGPELKKIIDNGEPKAYITQDQFSDVSAALQGTVDSVEHWLEYGDDGDGSYERLIEVARATTNRSGPTSSATTTRSSSSTPAARRASPRAHCTATRASSTGC